MIAAHVSGVPVEELAPFAGGGAALLVARGWLALLLYRRAR